MATKVRLVDGRDITIALDGKRVAEVLADPKEPGGLARFKTAAGARVWIKPEHVVAVEDRPDLD